MVQGDHWNCDGCDYEWIQKKRVGQPHQCPACKISSITNLSEEQEEKLRTQFIRLYGLPKNTTQEKISKLKREDGKIKWENRAFGLFLFVVVWGIFNFWVALIAIIIFNIWRTKNPRKGGLRMKKLRSEKIISLSKNESPNRRRASGYQNAASFNCF